MDFRRAPHTPTVPPQIQQWQWWRLYNFVAIIRSAVWRHDTPWRDTCFRNLRQLSVLRQQRRQDDDISTPQKSQSWTFLEALQTEFVMMKWMSCRAVGRPKSWKKILAQSVGIWLIITSLLCFREKKVVDYWMKLSLNFRAVFSSQDPGKAASRNLLSKQLHTSLYRMQFSLCVTVCVCMCVCEKTLRFFKCNFCHVCSLQRCSGTHSLSSRCLCLLVSDVTRHQVCAGGLWEAVQTNHWPGFLSKENKPSRWDTFVIFQESPSFRDSVQTCVRHTDKRQNTDLLDK